MRKPASLLLLTILLLTFSACGGSSGTPAASSPGEVATQYLQAIMAQDYTAVTQVLSDDLKASADQQSFEESTKSDGAVWSFQHFQKLEITDVQQSGDNATVTALLYFSETSQWAPDGTIEVQVDLQKFNGVWKVTGRENTYADTVKLVSVTPPGGTTLTAGESVTVTANISYTLKDQPDANLVLLYRTSAQQGYYVFGTTPVSQDNSVAEVSGKLLVPTCETLELHAELLTSGQLSANTTKPLTALTLLTSYPVTGTATATGTPQVTGISPMPTPAFADTVTLVSVTPPEGTTLTVGEPVTVTAKLSCDLTDVQDADLIFGYREKGSTDLFTLGTASVSVDNNVVEISGQINSVPNYKNLELAAFLAPSDRSASGSFTPLSENTALATYPVEPAATTAAPTTATSQTPSPTATASTTNSPSGNSLTLVSLTPPAGTLLKVGDQVTVTAKMSYTLADEPTADLQVLYREGTTNRYDYLGSGTVFRGSGTTDISCTLTVLDYEKLDLYAMMMPTAPSSSNGTVTPLVSLTLLASYPIETGTPTTTPPPSSGGNVTDTRGDVPYGFIDIVSARVEHVGNSVSAYLEMADLPATLVFNEAPENYQDYAWEVYFDADNNPDTGASGTTGVPKGVDYILSLSHFSRGGTQTAPLMGTCQAQVWAVQQDQMSVLTSDVTVTIQGNTLVLKGTIPGLSESSRWFVQTSYYDPKTQNPVRDRLPDSGFLPLG